MVAKEEDQHPDHEQRIDDYPDAHDAEYRAVEGGVVIEVGSHTTACLDEEAHRLDDHGDRDAPGDRPYRNARSFDVRDQPGDGPEVDGEGRHELHGLDPGVDAECFS